MTTNARHSSGARAQLLLLQLSMLVGCGSTDEAPQQAADKKETAPARADAKPEPSEESKDDEPESPPEASASASDSAMDPAEPASDAKPEMPESQPSDSTKQGASKGFVKYPDLRGGCDIKSNYPDDHACIPAPKPDEGIQIHIGPKNYDDPEEVAKYIMPPGDESSLCWIYRTPNTEDIYFQTYELSGRAGTHHILGSMLEGDVPTDQGFGRCADTREDEEGNASVKNLGPMPMASKPYMPRGQVAPENEHIAYRLPANVLAQADMHYYNFTDRDILREIWINLYFVPPEQVTGEMLRIRGMGGFGWSQEPIAPGTDMVYKYECPITGNGRILSLLGHYHAHGRRFTASVKRKSGGIDKVFEMYDYQEPANFEYNSVTTNPEFSDSVAGAFSGILEVKDGDVLAWECHIVNDSDVGLRYTNEVNTGEMCNVWGHSFGIDQWDCFKE
jgi:hypothetical protein